jgi:hypothetical protein
VGLPSEVVYNDHWKQGKVPHTWCLGKLAGHARLTAIGCRKPFIILVPNGFRV